jgi:heat shock protein HslJ
MMNNPEKTGITLAAQSDQFSVAPGDKLEIPLVLTNQGNAPDQVRISLEGIPLVWVSTEQQVVLLQPGEQAQVSLSIHPPRPPDAHAGRYYLKLRATSTLDPARSYAASVNLTIAAYEVKGRVGFLLESLQYTAIPGEQLAIPVVLINQGLSPDIFDLGQAGLPEGWVTSITPALRLAAGEETIAFLILQPPRLPDSRAGRHPFTLLVASRDAPNQTVSIDCTLTVVPFIEFNGSLEAANPDQNLPAKVLVQNHSNIPATFQVTWSSPDDSVSFDPMEPQQVNAPSGETAEVEYSAQPARRRWFGGEKSFPYTVSVQVSDGQAQSLDGEFVSKGVLPVWAAIAGVGVILLLCLFVVGPVLFPGMLRTSPTSQTPTVTSTNIVLAPTATQSQIDQKPLLIDRRWYLLALNDTPSSPGVQEPFSLFNPDGTLIGFTGCKDLSASYQTNYNQISISTINLGPGVCSETSLQRQEDSLLAILRSARSYFVADTAMQIAGDSGFLNYSLTPAHRPEEIQPPQAAIRAVPQSEVGQVVVFDGTGSNGQVPIVSWRWDFGDGAAASGAVVQHTYINPGTYEVSLTVTDQRGQTATVTQQIHILALPTLTSTPTVPPPTATPPQPTPPPEQPTYTPEPTAEPPTATPEPPPAPLPPQANIAGPGQGYIGEPVKFDASASQPGSSPIVSYSWSLGNGTDLPGSQESSISATYNRAGDYEVTVFVYDANGLSSHATTRININARLETAVWTLSMINNKPLLPGTAITMQFKEGELAGFAGCNTYNGIYTAELNDDGTYTITVGTLTTSRLACPQDIMEQEQEYLTSIQQATRATIQENRILLDSPSGRLDFYLVENP